MGRIDHTFLPLEVRQNLKIGVGARMDGWGLHQKLMVPAAARRRVTDTHGSFLTWPKWSTMLGMMSATMVWSREKKKTLERMAATGTILVLFVLRMSLGLGVFACESPSPPAYRTWRICCRKSDSVGGASFGVGVIGVRSMARCSSWRLGVIGLHCRGLVDYTLFAVLKS